MNKLYCKSGLVIVAMSVSLSGWAAGCMPIAKACMAAGYAKGDTKGKGLINDCVLPVVAKTKTLEGVTFTDDELADCKAKLAVKMPEAEPAE